MVRSELSKDTICDLLMSKNALRFFNFPFSEKIAKAILWNFR